VNGILMNDDHSRNNKKVNAQTELTPGSSSTAPFKSLKSRSGCCRFTACLMSTAAVQTINTLENASKDARLQQ
jgi:hypothetical protein